MPNSINAPGDMILYIIVVTYNAEKWISTFAPPFKSLPDNWKIIVVDNASTDRTLELLRRDYPDFYLLDNPCNLGFGQANNLGLKKALADNADFVFLLNQDARIEIAELFKLIDMHKKHPECSIISPLHYSLDEENLNGNFIDCCYPSYCPRLLADSFSGRLKDLYYTNFVNAAAWLMSRECLLTVGGFNPAFFHYCEDNDYINRVIFHGGKIGLAPQIKAYHSVADHISHSNIGLYTYLVSHLDPGNDQPRSRWQLLKKIFISWKKMIKKGERQKAGHLIRHCQMLFSKKLLTDKGRDLVKVKGPTFL